MLVRMLQNFTIKYGILCAVPIFSVVKTVVLCIYCIPNEREVNKNFIYSGIKFKFLFTQVVKNEILDFNKKEKQNENFIFLFFCFFNCRFFMT